tara:strand:- start:1386 stop:1862 length:477 start_codon:yes stop_codon:yes gene_type:complete
LYSEAIFILVGVVSALLLSLSFALFLAAPIVTFNAFAPGTKQSYLDMFGICSALSVCGLTNSVMMFSLFIVNANMLRDGAFILFLQDHIYILLYPTVTLLAGTVCMALALFAFGFLGYSLEVAYANIALTIFAAGVFGLVLLYSTYCRLWRTWHHQND